MASSHTVLLQIDALFNFYLEQCRHKIFTTLFLGHSSSKSNSGDDAQTAWAFINNMMQRDYDQFSSSSTTEPSTSTVRPILAEKILLTWSPRHSSSTAHQKMTHSSASWLNVHSKSLFCSQWDKSISFIQFLTLHFHSFT